MMTDMMALEICVQAVSAVTGVEARYVLGRDRDWDVARARHFLIWLLHEVWGLKGVAIERLLRRSNGVVSNSLDQVRNMISTSGRDQLLLKTLVEVTARLRESSAKSFEDWWANGGWLLAKAEFQRRWELDQTTRN